MPTPYQAARAVHRAYGMYRGFNRLTPKQQERFGQLLEKPPRELTDADRAAWMRLGRKWHGGEMSAWQELKWRVSLYTRFGAQL